MAKIIILLLTLSVVGCKWPDQNVNANINVPDREYEIINEQWYRVVVDGMFVDYLADTHECRTEATGDFLYNISGAAIVDSSGNMIPCSFTLTSRVHVSQTDVPTVR